MDSVGENRTSVILAGIGAVLLIIAVIAALLWVFDSAPDATPTPTPETSLATATPTRSRSVATETSAIGNQTAEPPVAVTPSATPEDSAPATATPTPSQAAATETTTAEDQTAEPPAIVTETATPEAGDTATPTVAADSGVIQGQVSLQGRPSSEGIIVLINGAPHGVTDAAGSFRVTVPAGEYTVRARYAKHIPIETQGVEVRAGQVTRLPPATLPAGDTDEDGDVDLFDLVRCAINLRKDAPATEIHGDANGDGVTDIRDVILARRNYGVHSPAPWQE